MCRDFDTDTDWNSQIETLARQKKVRALSVDPSIEGMLLRIHGVPTEGLSSKQLKTKFQTKFAGPAHDPKVYSNHFPIEKLEHAASNEPSLDELIKLLKPVS